MGNICSTYSKKSQKIKKRDIDITPLDKTIESIDDSNDNSNYVSTCSDLDNSKEDNIYNIYSQIYKDHDIFTAKELFQDQLITICRIIDVYDGDTCKIALQPIKNKKTIYRFSIRLNGIDTPEIRTRNEEEKLAAIQARNKLISMIIKGGKKEYNNKVDINEKTKSKEIKSIFTDNIYLAKIETQGFDKYGRLLAEIFPYYDNGNELSYNQTLINEKMAYLYNGGTKKEFK